MLRVLETGAGHPHRNMAVDEALLEEASDAPVLRLYAWKPFGLSLGRFQPCPAGLEQRARQAGYEVTRRLTGGGAVLHAHETTYALVAPKPARGNRALYRAANRALLHALEVLGVRARERGGPFRPDRGFLCFDRRADFDVVVEGRKIAGSAQRMRRGRVLQHGSLVLEDPPAVPGLPHPPPAPLAGRGLGPDRLARALIEGFGLALGLRPRPSVLTGAEEALARRLAETRYATAEWIHRRGRVRGKGGDLVTH